MLKYLGMKYHDVHSLLSFLQQKNAQENNIDRQVIEI